MISLGRCPIAITYRISPLTSVGVTLGSLVGEGVGLPIGAMVGHVDGGCVGPSVGRPVVRNSVYKSLVTRDHPPSKENSR